MSWSHLRFLLLRPSLITLFYTTFCTNHFAKWLGMHLRYRNSIWNKETKKNRSCTKMFLLYLWVLPVLTARMSQIFLGKIMLFYKKGCLALTRLWISRNFQDLIKKSSTFQGLFKTPTNIQDLFKIVQTIP